MIEAYDKGEFQKDFKDFQYLQLFGKLPPKPKKDRV